jgi:hypothetical protein
LTPQQFWALWERRATEFKRQTYLHGLPTSAIYNVNRAKTEDHVFSPFDFVPRYIADEQREQIIHAFKKLRLELPPSRLSEAKQAWLTKLQELGRADAAEMIAEIFEDT